ncbi:MAG: DUF445 family protein [Clostridiales bacterium]|nr:DUF445 family protein [Clostridiales bacterium]
MFLRFFIPAFIGGIIGWITNVLAIKMLLRPIYPIHIPIIDYKIQGLLPKRREEIAVSVGLTIEEELIDIDEILEKISNDKNRESALTSIKSAISEKINKKIPILVPFIIRENIVSYIEDQIDKEAPLMIENLVKDLYEKTSKEISIGKMVEDKINQIDLTKLEEITLRLAKRELKHIEILGGILGAIIGLVQGILMIVLSRNC